MHTPSEQSASPHASLVFYLEETGSANHQVRRSQPNDQHDQSQCRGSPEIAQVEGKGVRQLVRRPHKGYIGLDIGLITEQLGLYKQLYVAGEDQNKLVNDVRLDQGKFDVDGFLPGIATIHGGGFHDFSRDALQSAVLDGYPHPRPHEETHDQKDECEAGRGNDAIKGLEAQSLEQEAKWAQ